MAISTSELNGWNAAVDPSTLVSAIPNITPAMAAMNAEMQNTMILVMLVDSPSVETAV